MVGIVTQEGTEKVITLGKISLMLIENPLYSLLL